MGITQKAPVDVSVATPESLGAEGLRELTQLINAVYADAESGMWVEGAERTNEAEVREMVAKGRILLAKLEGRIVGSVHCMVFDETQGVGEFGMLVCDPTVRGKGIGTALVKAAEQRCREAGCRTMRLELLTPREWKHPFKEYLKAWYTRIGYVPQATEPFEKMYPQLCNLLATPCDFTPYLKPLN